MVDVQVDEVVAVSRHAHQEIPIFRRAGLGLAQGCGVHHVELDVVAVELEVSPDEARHLLDALFSFEDRGQEALVQQRASGAHLIHLAQRFDHRRGAVAVRPVGRRGAVGFRQMGPPAVGRGAEHLAEVHVARGGKHVQMVGLSLGAHAAVDGVQQRGIDALHEGIGVVVVVAKTGGLVHQEKTQILPPLEIGLESAQEIPELQVLVLVDVLLDRRKAVRHGADAAALDVGGVVPGASVVVVLALGDAVVDDHRQEGGGGVGGEHALQIVVHPDLRFHHVLELPGKRFVELVEGGERPGISRGDAHLLAREGIHPVVQGHFKDFGNVEIAREDIGFLPEAPRLDAAAGAPFPGVFHGFPHAHLLHDHRVGIKDGGIAIPLADDPTGGLQKAVRGLGAELEVCLGLEEVHFVQHVQQKIGNLAGAVGAVAPQPADVDVGKIVVGAAFQGRDAHLGGSGVVVELDPEALQELLGPFPVQRSRRRLPGVEGLQVLVQMPRVHGVPAIELHDGSQMHEPVGLEGLPEVPGGMGRHVAAVFRDAPQFFLALGIGFPGRHLLGPLGVTDRKAHDGVAGDGHGLEFFVFRHGLGVVQEIELPSGLGDLFFEVQHALTVDGAVQRGVPRSPLFHELRKESRLVKVFPFLGNLGEGLVAHAAAPPIGDDLFPVGGDVLRRHGVVRHGPGIEDLQILHGMTGELGEGGHGLGLGSPLSHDEFAVADVDGLMFADVKEVQSPHHGDGMLPFVSSVKFGFQHRPLDGDPGTGIHAGLPQFRHSLVHNNHPPILTVRPKASSCPFTCSTVWAEGGSVCGRR